MVYFKLTSFFERIMKRPCLLSLACAAAVFAQQGNRLHRLEWFRDQGFGLFIHWSVDSQIGSVIRYSLVGAADDYVRRFFTELPKTFNPRNSHPEGWAALAKRAGVRYIVFTAKHHWVRNVGHRDHRFVNHTPFHEDIFSATVKASRSRESRRASIFRRKTSIGCTRAPVYVHTPSALLTMSYGRGLAEP